MPVKLLQNSLYLASCILLLVSCVLYLQRYGIFVHKIIPVTGDIQIAGTATYSGKLTAPAVLDIPGLGINLTVVPAYMEGKKWPTTPSGVSYLANSAIPGDNGNAVFYGHNWPSVLGSLKQAKVGEKLVISYIDGSTREFTVDNVFVVGPNSTEILAQSDTPKITIYTCTGFLDTQRLVVTAI